MKQTLLTVLLTITIQLSFSQKLSIKEIDFDKENYELYIVYSKPYYGILGKCEPERENWVFRTSNPQILKRIQSDYLKEINQDSLVNPGRCMYLFQLIKNNVIEWNGYLLVENQILANSHERFGIKISEFFKELDSFEPVNSCLIKVSDLGTARKLNNILESNDAFLYEPDFFLNTTLSKYNGEIILKIDTSEIKIEKDIRKYKVELKEKLKNCGNIRFGGIGYQESGSKVLVSFYTEKDISEQIPKKYEIAIPYSELENIFLTIIDMDEKTLKRLVRKNRLKGITFMDIKKSSKPTPLN